MFRFENKVSPIIIKKFYSEDDDVKINNFGDGTITYTNLPKKN